MAASAARLMKKASAGWDNSPPREYVGWNLPERSSAAMASVGVRIRWPDVRPGDLLITMGAGDVTRLGQELVARLEKQSVDGDPDDRSRPS